MISLASFLAVAVSGVPVLAALQQYQLNIVNAVVSPDGGPSRSAVLANGTVPGPLISANAGDNLQVKLVNQLTDTSMAQGTSIHWHGLFHTREAEMDGVAWVTQCPIAPMHNFTYNLTLHQTGTYWYHSHITTQYCDGLRGPLIIYDPYDPLKFLYDVDDENTVITLGDWLHNPSPSAFQHLENPESTIINGLGRLTANSTSPLAIVNVQSGLRYRFRIVNTACISGFNFSIDGHDMSVIEIDGNETFPSEPFGVLTIWPGQRVSILLKADQQPGNYWIRAEPIFFGGTPNNDTGVNMAILRYAGAPVAEPKTNQTDLSALHEQTLTPLELYDISGTPDYSFVFDISLNPGGTAFQMDGQTFTPPPVPVLLQILNGKSAFELMPEGDVIPLRINKLVEITVPGGGAVAPHPFHLHGHKFAVIRSVGSNRVNTFNPPVRDTVDTGTSTTDNVTIRFRTDNPGPWIFHCHIDFHLEAGLAVVFAEDVPGQQSGRKNVTITQSWEDLCPTWNSLTSGKQFSLNDVS